MGLKDILEKIAEQRDRRIGELTKEHKRKVSAMNAESAGVIKKEKTRIGKESSKEREIYANLKLSEAKRSVKREQLVEKERLINRTLNDVLNQFGEFKGTRYHALLAKLVSESVELLEGNCRIQASREEDIPHLRKLSLAPVGDTTVQGKGGAVIVSKDGAFKIDRTFDYLMEKKGGDLRKMIAGILFEEE